MSRVLFFCDQCSSYWQLLFLQGYATPAECFASLRRQRESDRFRTASYRSNMRHTFGNPRVGKVVQACFTALAFCGFAVAQFGSAPSSQRQSSSSSGSSGAPVSYSGNQSPFMGSVPEAKEAAGVLPLSFKEAIDRGLRNNLGLLLQSDSVLAARGTRWK